MRQPTVEVFHYIPTRHRVCNGCRDSLTRQLWHQLTVVLFHDIPKYQCVDEFHDHNETHRREAVVLYIIISQLQQYVNVSM